MRLRLEISAILSILFCAHFAVGLGRAEEKIDARLNCMVSKTASGRPALNCRGRGQIFFTKEIAFLDPEIDTFNQGCSYRYSSETKKALRERLITEDLFRWANTGKTVCFENHIQEEQAKDVPNLVQPVENSRGVPSAPPTRAPTTTSSPFSTQKRNRIAQTYPPRPGPVQEPEKRKTLKEQLPPELIVSKTQIRKKTRGRWNDSKDQPKGVEDYERRRTLVIENRRIGYEPPAVSIQSLPGTLIDAIQKATRPKDVLQRKLEVSLAIDSSASMEGDIRFLGRTLQQLKSGWSLQYPDGVVIHLVEYGQTEVDYPRLRKVIENGGVEDLERYLTDFKTNGHIEPKFAALDWGIEKLSDPSPGDAIQREVITITDEAGDVFEGDPSPEGIRQMLQWKQAKFTSINPDDFKRKNPVQFEAPEGATFQASTGRWVRTLHQPSGQMGWKVVDGPKELADVIWLDPPLGRVTYVQAVGHCASFISARLPTFEEFEAGEKVGIREAMPDFEHGGYRVLQNARAWIRGAGFHESYMVFDAGNFYYASGTDSSRDYCYDCEWRDRYVRCIGVTP